MRVLVVLILFVCSFAQLRAQKENQKIFDLARVSSHYSYDQLLDFAEANLSEEEDIARFFYYWIAQNISYDFSVALFDMRKADAALETEPLTVFTMRKGTCIGYANLYAAFLGYFGIVHKTVLGYSRHHSNVLQDIKPVPDHAWSAIYLKDDWHLVDVTWAVSNINDPFSRDHYFMTNPQAFHNDHLPMEMEWFLSEEKISVADFERQPLIMSPYYGLARKELIDLQLMKNEQGETVLRFDLVPGWTLRLQAVDEHNEKAMKLKYKRKRGRTFMEYTLKNYQPGTILRLDALKTFDNGNFKVYQGLAYIRHPDWQKTTTRDFKQFSTKQNRFRK